MASFNIYHASCAKSYVDILQYILLKSLKSEEEEKTLFTITTIGVMEGIIIMDGHDPCSHDQPWHFDRKEGSQCKKLLAAAAATAAAVIFSANISMCLFMCGLFNDI